MIVCWAELLAGSILVEGAPVVENASFEADRYSVWPGTANANGKRLTGWNYVGNVGVNPVWKDPQAQRGPDSPFHDNGQLLAGKQLAFIQGRGRLTQSVPGFEKGKHYRVTFRENARIQRQGDQWPQVQVKLGGVLIVSPHEVTPVVMKRNDFSVPFYRVESGVFTAPDNGAYELVIETVQESPTTTLLIDDIHISELP
ncbi:MAG: hypothetical protein ACUVX8_03160 [Candidatus Zipacnadales bacterium]